jgi:hypothetical protein
VKKRNGGSAGILLLAAGVVVCFGVVLTCPPSSTAQERATQANALGGTRQGTTSPRAMAYTASRETVLQGTVIEYQEAASTAPIGAHAKVQTTGGIADVHLGPASYLKARRFSLAAGDAVRFVGVAAAGKTGSVFLARTVERGGETLILRSPRGGLAANGAARAQAARDGAQSQRHGGAR